MRTSRGDEPGTVENNVFTNPATADSDVVLMNYQTEELWRKRDNTDMKLWKRVVVGFITVPELLYAGYLVVKEIGYGVQQACQ